MNNNIMKYAFWGAILILLEVLLVSIFFRSDWLTQNMEKENQKNAYYFGIQTSEKIKQDAQEFYTEYLVEPGIVDQSYYMLLPQNESNGVELDLSRTGLFDKVSDILGTFWVTAYQLIMRVQVWLLWAPAILLLLIPAVIDGVVMRKVKVATHQTTSSIRMKYAILTIIICVLILLLSLFSPFAVSPLLYLVLSMTVTAMISVILANVQKDI